MRWAILSLLCLIVLNATAQESDYEFNLLRQDDNHTFLDEKTDKSFYDKLKWSPISDAIKLSFGGSVRGQYEQFHYEEFGALNQNWSGWYLQRVLIHSDIQIKDSFGLFVELGSSLVAGKENLAPVDKDELYINQLLLSYDLGNWNFKIGRENHQLGSRRLIDVREGPNVRRAFDRVEVSHQIKDAKVTAFYSNLVQPRPGVFDNEITFKDEQVWGIYGSEIISTNVHLDLYYLGIHYNEILYERGIGEEHRSSFGARFWKANANWGFDNEVVLQIGSFADTNILAWTASVNLWRKVNSQNKLGVKTELISGDNGEGSLGTFNPLYPRGAYFGRVARFGPSNLIDIHPYWTYKQGRFSAEVDYDVFWRYSTDDAVYGPAMNIVLEGESNQRLIAQQIGTLFNFEFSPFFMIELETNYIFVGDHIKEVVQDEQNLFHMVFTSEFRF